MAKNLSTPPMIMGLSKAKIIALITIILALIIAFILFNNKNYNTTILNPASKSIQANFVPMKSNSTTDVLDSINQQKNQIKSNSTQVTIPPITIDDIKLLQMKQKLAELSSKQAILTQARASRSLVFVAKDIKLDSISKSIINSPSKNFEEDQKNSILKQPSSKPEGNSTYLDATIQNPRSPYELKAGSFIPATMINGLNSDLAGEVVAYVRANVYDSASRRYLLIPQGAKLVGLYDSHVLYGQQRILVAWNRLIYPDGSSIRLNSMPGTDIQGYSGFHDKVDNKYWRIFGASFIIGVITGGMQYAQNQNTTNNLGSPTVQQSVSVGLAQQMGQTGLAIANKNLNLQPTITIRPNYPFTIMTTADMVLKPWRVLN